MSVCGAIIGALLILVAVIAPWFIAIRASESARDLRTVVDKDRESIHRAVQSLRSLVDARKADTEALRRRIDLVERSAGALALRQIIDDDRATVQALGRRVTAVERALVDLNEAFDGLALETGETKMMESPFLLSQPTILPPPASEQAPPSTRRHGKHPPSASPDQVPRSGRTLAGVGPFER